MADEGGDGRRPQGLDSAGLVRELLRTRIEESNRLQAQLNDAVARLAEVTFVLEEKEFELKSLRMSLDSEQKRSAMYEEELRNMQQLYQQVLASAAARPAASAARKPSSALSSPSNSATSMAVAERSRGSSQSSPSKAAGDEEAAVQEAEPRASLVDEKPDKPEEQTEQADSDDDDEAAAPAADKSLDKGGKGRSGGEGCYSGWMYKLKLGKRFKQNWKRRYFTLTDTHLHYYVNQNDTKPKGSMAIICLTVNSRVSKDLNLGDKEFCFSVVEDLSWLDAQNDQRRTYVFATDSQGEQKEWVSLLKAAKANAHKTQQKGGSTE